MTLEWKQLDSQCWKAGEHTIFWQRNTGYVHVIGARQRHNLPSLAAAKAWAETLENPDRTFLILADIDLEATLAIIIARRIWCEIAPIEDGLWRITTTKEFFRGR